MATETVLSQWNSLGVYYSRVDIRGVCWPFVQQVNDEDDGIPVTGPATFWPKRIFMPTWRGWHISKGPKSMGWINEALLALKSCLCSPQSPQSPPICVEKTSGAWPGSSIRSETWMVMDMWIIQWALFFQDRLRYLLVGGLEHFLFSHILGIIIQID